VSNDTQVSNIEPGGTTEPSSGSGPSSTSGSSSGSEPSSKSDAGPAVEDAPGPDSPAKPDSPGKLMGKLWTYALRRTVKEFSSDQCTDMAAALTYYALLSIFPALVALVSILGLIGDGKAMVDSLMTMIEQVAPSGSLDTIRTTLEQLSSNPRSGIGLVVGIVGAIWGASGYVGAFARVMNRIYEVREGRPIWKLRPQVLLVTVLMLGLVAVAAATLALSGPVASAVGDLVGLGDTARQVWNIAKWPLLLILVIVIVAILYYGTPNVRQPKFRWLSTGAVVAIVIWVLASAGFGFYVANFSSYSKTYGSLAGVIVFLLWLWITNLALLLGAELDSELERARQLQAGLAAEEHIQLPARDTRKTRKAEKGMSKLTGQATELRHRFSRRGKPAGPDDHANDNSTDTSRGPA
jgi:membrane protein